MQDQRSVRDSAAASESMAADKSSSSTRPVLIPEPKALPYSRLSLRAHSASSVSPSPSQRILSTGSPGQDYTLAPLQSLQGSGLQPLNPGQQGQLYPRSRPGDSPRGPAQQQNKRPPLPPSPQASRAQAAAGSFNPLTPAWINPGDGSGSGSGGRQPRLLSAAATGSYGEPGPLSSAVGSSSGIMSLRQYSYLQQQQQQQQQQQYGQYASSTGSAHSLSPSADGLLAAAVASEDVATAAGNPYHPQHESAMQLLLEHQAQQLQQLQQQRDQTSMGGSSISSGRAGNMRASSFSNAGLSPRSPRISPRVSPRAPSRSSSYNRVSELGTSPGLIEASFMGMAARCSQQTTSSSSTSRSATLQQMMQQQQAAIRAQQEEQQRSLQHSRSTVSFGEWNGSQMGSGSDSATESRSGSRPVSAGGRYWSESTGAQQALDWDTVQQQLQQQQQQQGPLGGVGASVPRVGEGRGLRALPGRPGLHWLSRADERESAARGLLGLPRPGRRPFSSSSSSKGQRQQQQSPRQRQIAAAAGNELQQQQGAGAAEQEEGQGESYTAAGEADDDICLHTPAAAAATQPTPQRIQYDPAVFASYSAAVAGANGVQRAASSSGSPMAASASRSLFSSRSFGRQNSSMKERAQSAGSDPLRRSGSYISMPTCLICLDQLTPGDFESGEAMYLACRCKGEVALRHRQCAEKWSRIKGNTICDVCKAPILNLPEVSPLPAPPPPPAMDDRLFFQGTGLWGPLGDEPPAVADYVFDCIRVTWVVLIVCILFFELTVSRAFVTGALVGSAYVALTASLASCRRLRRQRQQEEGEGGAWQEGLRVPLLGGSRAHLLPV